MVTHKQLPWAEIFEECQNKFNNDKYPFLSLLDESINLGEIVPVSFVTPNHIFWNTLRNCVIFVALMLHPMAQNLPVLNRISYRTYNLCSIIFLIWSNQYAKNWIPPLTTWQSLIPLALKHKLWKIILSMPTVSSNNWKLLFLSEPNCLWNEKSTLWMKTVCFDVHMILHFPWSGKEATLI